MNTYISHKHFHLIADLAKTKNFSETARKFHIAQSNLSSLIASVEASLGTQIFNRDSRPISLTEFGKGLMPYIEKMLDSQSGMNTFVDSWQNASVGRIRMACSVGIQAWLVRHFLPDMLSGAPGLNITMLTANQLEYDYFKGSLLPENADVMVSYTQPSNKNLIAIKACVLRLNIYSTDAFYRDHPFSSFRQLAEHPFILMNSLGQTQDENILDIKNIQTGETDRITVSGSLHFDNGYIAAEACRQGMGYLLYSHLQVREDDLLKARLDENHGVFLPIYIIYRRQDKNMQRIKNVVSTLRDTLASLEY
ncbi:LysR family transcriptional regulator [Enterobacter asburiae]|uniref:LysR family transcriptional regulator n=1 Tax=Enterobacter asburiae TaxID=61645 RepID=UPI0021490B36|nr:LysR family transcriptional regulator [Enterobacter asburiae]UUR73848.1 LysR family transcriptional regulator [Enterobacter asburiae]